MSKVTSKLQVTIPKAVARTYKLGPGSDVVFEAAGDVIRLRPAGAQAQEEHRLGDLAWRLQLFDAATARQQARDRRFTARAGQLPPKGRGWRREDLYQRGLPG